MDIRESDILGTDIAGHWYYRAKAEAMQRLLDADYKRILDVGAGSGFFSRQLLGRPCVQEAWCVDLAYGAEADGLEAGKPIHLRRTIQVSNADLVLMMDVLEHVDDDVGMLQEYSAKVPPGTTFLISVPAFQSLWSGHDVFLGHRRRYRLEQLEACVRRAGLSVRTAAYFFGAVFPLAVVTRLASRCLPAGAKPRSQLRRHHPWVDGALYALCSLEMPVMKSNRLFGLTVFCVAQTKT